MPQFYKFYPNFQNSNQKKRHQAHDPAKIYGMREIYAQEKGWDLREDQPKGKSDHGDEQRPCGMGTSAYAGPEQGHESDQSVGCCQRQPNKHCPNDPRDRSSKEGGENTQNQNRQTRENPLSSFPEIGS